MKAPANSARVVLAALGLLCLGASLIHADQQIYPPPAGGDAADDSGELASAPWDDESGEDGDPNTGEPPPEENQGSEQLSATEKAQEAERQSRLSTLEKFMEKGVWKGIKKMATDGDTGVLKLNQWQEGALH